MDSAATRPEHVESILRLVMLGGLIWLAVSVAVIARWAERTRFGLNVLAARPPRPNFLQLPTVLLLALAFLMLTWIVGASLQLMGLIEPAAPGAPMPPLSVFYVQLGTVLAEAVTVILVLAVASRAFVGGLTEGFGLRWRTFGRDAGRGAAILLVIFPLTIGLHALTVLAFQWLGWPTPVNPILKFYQQREYPALVVLAIGFAVLVAPVAEEIFFRGLLQSFLVRLFVFLWPPRGSPLAALSLRPPEFKPPGELLPIPPASEPAGPPARSSEPAGPPARLSGIPVAVPIDQEKGILSPRAETRRVVWAIALTSAAFALIHGWVDAPTIFVLAMALGYAYQATGSLITCITMHLVFNLLNTAMFFAAQRLGLPT